MLKTVGIVKTVFECSSRYKYYTTWYMYVEHVEDGIMWNVLGPDAFEFSCLVFLEDMTEVYAHTVPFQPGDVQPAVGSFTLRVKFKKTGPAREEWFKNINQSRIVVCPNCSEKPSTLLRTLT